MTMEEDTKYVAHEKRIEEGLYIPNAWFDFITLNITSKGVIVDKLRFVPIKKK